MTKLTSERVHDIAEPFIAPIGDRLAHVHAIPDNGRIEAFARAIEAEVRAEPPAPVDMVLHCQACGLQHIDAEDRTPTPAVPEGVTGVFDAEHESGARWSDGIERRPAWTNPPHRSHLCHGCGHTWRPADVPTNGVAAVKTAGRADSPATAPLRRKPTDVVVCGQALRQLLVALNGPSHYIGELQATRSLHRLGHANAIETLMEQFNSQAQP